MLFAFFAFVFLFFFLLSFIQSFKSIKEAELIFVGLLVSGLFMYIFTTGKWSFSLISVIPDELSYWEKG